MYRRNLSVLLKIQWKEYKQYNHGIFNNVILFGFDKNNNSLKRTPILFRNKKKNISAKNKRKYFLESNIINHKMDKTKIILQAI